MKDVRSLARSQAAFGDVAVDGLIAGVGAGILMAAYVVATGFVLGEGPGVVLSRFDPAVPPLPQIGILMHLAVSAIYGILFGLGERVIIRGPLNATRSTSLGLLYGLGLFVLAEAVLQAAPNRVVYGSDWPHVAVPHEMPNTGRLRNLLATWIPDEDLRHRVLVDNPAELYGFPPVAEPHRGGHA